MLYGIDTRGAFALHSGTGSVLYTPRVERPSFPPVRQQAGAPVVLKAALDPAQKAKAWRVGWTPNPPETPGSAKAKPSLLWLWITLGVVGVVAVVVFVIFRTKRGRARSRPTFEKQGVKQRRK